METLDAFEPVIHDGSVGLLIDNRFIRLAEVENVVGRVDNDIAEHFK